MIASQFSFLKQKWSDVFDIITDVEKYLYVSPNISLIKLKQLEELLLKNIIRLRKVPISFEELGLKKTIESLVSQNIIPVGFFELLEEIRVSGQNAIQENYSDLTKATELFESSLELVAWFVSYYGNEDYSDYVRQMDLKYKSIFQEYLVHSKSEQLVSREASNQSNVYSFISEGISFDDFIDEHALEKTKMNIFSKDVFESEEEFKERVQSYGLLNIGAVTIDTSNFKANTETILLNVTKNQDLAVAMFDYDIFYANLNELQPYIAMDPIIKCKLLGTFVVLDGVVRVNHERLFIDLGEHQVSVYPVWFNRYDFEDEETFAKRIAAIPKLEVGMLRLVKDEYDQALELFPVDLRNYKYTSKLNVPSTGLISIDRFKARDLYKSGVVHPLMADFKIMGDRAAIKQMSIHVTIDNKAVSFEVYNYDNIFEQEMDFNNSKIGLYDSLKIAAGKGNIVAEHILGGIDGYPVIDPAIHGDQITYNPEMVEQIKKCAESGDSNLKCKLGEVYFYGLGIEMDQAKAMKYFAEAAEQGEKIAQYQLGQIHFRGIGVNVDYDKAKEWFEKAANQGDALAQYMMGYLFKNGLGVPENNEEAVRWLALSAEQGNTTAQTNLGYMYQYGLGVEVDYPIALHWYESAASNGDASAENNLGYLYQYGLGVETNYEEAFRCYKRAAEKGNSSAQNNLGFLYQVGLGVSSDIREAVNWYKLSAENGNVSAQHTLGYIYRSGVGVPQNDKIALKWFRHAADQEDAASQYNLGVMFENGEGVERDYQQALKWYVLAADQDNADAQAALGKLYEKGLGVERDYKEAYNWYKQSAKMGNSNAQRALGHLYEKGLGVAADMEQAKIWYQMAKEERQEEEESQPEMKKTARGLKGLFR